MRKTKLSQEEIAELDATKAREARNAGLKLLPVRQRLGKTLEWSLGALEYQVC